MFGTNIAFKVDGGDNIGSVFGASISILVALIVTAYGFNKFVIMKYYEDTSYNDYTVKNGLSTETFGNDQLQLQIAFGTFEGDFDEETQ